MAASKILAIGNNICSPSCRTFHDQASVAAHESCRLQVCSNHDRIDAARQKSPAVAVEGIEMRKLILEEPESVRRTIRAAVKGSRDQLLLHKLHCVLLVGLGRSCHEVASWFGDDTRTIERWVGAFNRQGVGGLCPHLQVGRTSQLPADTAQRVAFEIKQPPFACGFPDMGWGGKLLKQHLISHYGVTMSLRQCQRFLRRLRTGNPPLSRA